MLERVGVTKNLKFCMWIDLVCQETDHIETWIMRAVQKLLTYDEHDEHPITSTLGKSII